MIFVSLRCKFIREVGLGIRNGKTEIMKRFLLFAALALAAWSCTKGDYESDLKGGGDPGEGYYGGDYEMGGEPGADYGDYDGGGSSSNGGGAAGVLTAGEWNDLAHWDFWGSLMSYQPDPNAPEEQRSPDYARMAYEWGFNTSRRVAVSVKDEAGNPVANVPVELLLNGDVIWKTRTSNKGNAELWRDLFSARGQESTSTEPLAISINGKKQALAPEISDWTGVKVNEYTVSAAAPDKQADIAFIVDATGSMTDEIDFLKKDLLSILEKVQQSQAGVAIRTGAVFYRDKGDTYLTRSDDFSKPAKTMEFIRKQEADGGGDLPEAVHSALEVTLSSLSWNAAARTRMAFLILDAPAHLSQQGVVASLQKSIQSFSALGIRMIPVLASTGDKTTEFMCRDFAIVTGGTYVFLTDDSGIGGEHLTPSVGEYEVEKLNDLLIRLIEDYIR